MTTTARVVINVGTVVIAPTMPLRPEALAMVLDIAADRDHGRPLNYADPTGDLATWRALVDFARALDGDTASELAAASTTAE